MMTAKRAFLFIIGFLLSLAQIACAAQVTMEPTTTIIFSNTSKPSITFTLTSVPTLRASRTPSPTVDATQQTWRATAVAIQTAERAASQKALAEKETQIAQFPTPCDDLNNYSSNISPDGKWFAASCGYKRNQTLTVQSKDGTKWVLDFKDFLSPEGPTEIMGSLIPKFWSPEGNYLFFTITLGYSGGGNYCFPRDRGAYGLFRLNLSNGSWTTVIPSTDSFPGYEVKFSPTGRRYAITLDGVMISDLQTGKSTKIKVNGVIQRLSWSPDGKSLAYSFANCDDEKIISSSTYVWDATTNQSQILFETDGIILRPELWIDNSALRISGEEIIDFNSVYTIYEYNIEARNLLFTGTETPSPYCADR